MADKISFYGLSGSGKSCFIFAMSQALSQGIKFSDGELMTVITPNPRQMIRLYKAYEQMVNGSWPLGNNSSVTYNFNVRKALELLMDIEIKDYRGGLLDSDDDDDLQEQDELIKSFEDSKALLFFFGADKVKAAMNGDVSAHFNFIQFNALYNNYLQTENARETPVMVVISKSDMLSPVELVEAKNFVKKQMQQLFAKGTNLTAGITAVSLGKNLTNVKGELEGELDIRATAGNLSIPILFALYHVMGLRIEKAVNNVHSWENNISSSRVALGKELSRNSFVRFFVDNEASIRQRIASQTTGLQKEKDLLLKLNSSMSAIKSYLMTGAELYYNGEKIN
jgi:hypothetical protein